ncbi:MAG: AAA family ATPase [Elainellaceae cyanobacterium]
MPNGFASNWAYLKTELNWLERVLMVALSRQRQEQKAINRVARSQADQVSAHWWKGLVSLDGKPAYDEHRPKATSPSVGYQQQLQTRIQASDQNGVVLLLPLLRDRLQLTLFEKNLVLMALAPEVNRRYSRLYQYLQSSADSELPTLELALRLLCRNDGDWQTARQRLSDRSPLVGHHLVQLVRPAGGTFLGASVRVLPRLVDLLLSEATAADLDGLLQEMEGDSAASAAIGASTPLPVQFSGSDRNAPQGISGIERPSDAALTHQTADVPTADDALATIPRPVVWDDLILPRALMGELKYLSDRIALQVKVDCDWGFEHQSFGASQPGTLALLTGAAGTGKTLAARAVANAAGHPLLMYDLETISPGRWSSVLESLASRCSDVVLIKAARLWFGPTSEVNALSELIAQRQKHPTLTLLSARQPAFISPQWRRRMDRTLSFPTPAEGDRLALWKGAFPQGVQLGRLRWPCLATLPVTGGEIVALAREAALLAAAESSERIMQRHVSAALRRQGHQLPSKK